MQLDNRKDRLRGTRGSPIGSNDRVAADIDAFGFRLAVNFRKGRPVLLFLKDSTHSLLSLDFFFFLQTPFYF